MSAGEELRQAAGKLRKLAADATPGPWNRPLNNRRKNAVRGELPDGERGEWIGGIDPSTGKRERCVVASIPIWTDGKFVRARGGRDLEYIAAMHPGVGTALVDLLDAAAKHEREGMLCCDNGSHRCEVVAPALAVARQILGEVSP